MAYVKKSPSGLQIIAVSDTQETGYDYIEDDNPELLGFLRQQHNAKVCAALAEVDLKCIRALRAKETDYIKQYEDQAIELRSQLQP
jgi:hypothetical protein